VASIGNDPNGRKRILFVAGDGSRKTIRLGKVSTKQAEAFKVKVEALIGHGITGAMADETARWLADLPDPMHARLAAVGLIPERQSTRLAAFLDAYIASRVDVKDGTAVIWGHTRRCLVDFFGADKPLRDITPGDADAWRLYLIAQKGKIAATTMSDNTVRRRCGLAKQFFRAAVRLKLIPSNPFADLKAAIQANKRREYFVSRQEAAKVLDACPDAEWRLLFALCRYGGLRCPSEPLGLKWQDVDWAGGRMLVHSPKTEHHTGGESRLVPLFPELLPYLRQVFEQAEPGTEHVISKWRYHGAGTNLRTGLLRIMAKAGLKPWPKLFQNLRATRETELAESWPMHVVCAWIGNSQAVARKHYLQVTEDHFRRAARNPAQYPAESGLPERKAETAGVQKSPDLPQDSEPYMNVHKGLVGATGFEPVTSWV